MLEEVLPFETSLLVWKACYAGDVCEISATIAEQGNKYGGPFWDKTEADLLGQTLGREPVPVWWALPWLTDAIAEGRVDYT